MAKTALILTLDSGPHFMESSALLKHMALLWKKNGLKIKVARGIEEEIEADVVIPHIDLTVLPDAYSEFLKKYPRVINTRVNDISKSLISNNLLTMETSYEGQVIVKTEANCGGFPEFYRNKRNEVSPAVPTTERPWRDVRHINSQNYLLFTSAKEVPIEVWGNKYLVVEKFLPERDSKGNYAIRKWFCFGDQSIGLYQTSTQPIIKSAQIENKIISDVPDEVLAMREKFGVDFGRFDYSIVNGKPIIFDLNKTPAIMERGLALLDSKLADFATGIRSYLEPHSFPA